MPTKKKKKAAKTLTINIPVKNPKVKPYVARVISGATAERLVKESIRTAGVTGSQKEIQFVDSDILAAKLNEFFNPPTIQFCANYPTMDSNS
jgi:hypothetical protein